MTNAPYLLPKARGGYRMGHGEILDHMFFDGLQSPFDGKLMGHFADATAQKYGFTRARAGRIRHRVRAARACAPSRRRLRGEITPVTVKGRKGDVTVDEDETPFTCDIEKIRDAQARLQQGRHGHRGQLLVDLRRRGCAVVMRRKRSRSSAA